MAFEHPCVDKAVRGHPGALEYLRVIARVLHFWDDLIDRDHELDDATINARMFEAVLTLPTNAFYAENADALAPILTMAIVNWRIATAMEREAEKDMTTRNEQLDDLRIAFIIRSTYVDLVTMCATIIGGIEHAVACGPEIRRWAHNEGFDGYLRNLAQEVTARKERDHVLR